MYLSKCKKASMKYNQHIWTACDDTGISRTKSTQGKHKGEKSTYLHTCGKEIFGAHVYIGRYHQYLLYTLFISFTELLQKAIRLRPTKTSSIVQSVSYIIRPADDATPNTSDE